MSNGVQRAWSVRESNPLPPDTVWATLRNDLRDGGTLRQSQLSSELFDTLGSNGSLDFVQHSQEEGSQPSAPRKRGRPPGSLNKSTIAALMSKDELANEAPPVKRGRGRPLGSKNKPKFPEGMPILSVDSATGTTITGMTPPAKRGPGRPKGSKNKPKSPATSSFVRRISFDSPEREGDELTQDDEIEEIRPPPATTNGDTQPANPPWRSHSATQNRVSLATNREHPASPPRQPQREPRPPPSEDASHQQLNDVSMNSTPVMTPARISVTIPPEFQIDASFLLSYDDSEDIELNLAPPPQSDGTVSQNPERVPDRVKTWLEQCREVYLNKRDIASDMPRLYSSLRTFWVPQESHLFTGTPPADASGLPSQLRFFFWDPRPLVQGGIPCPNRRCQNKLSRLNEVYNLRRILDLNDSYWLVSTRYRCVSCARTGPPGSQRTYRSWERKIVESLPQEIMREFPLVYTPTGAIDKALYAFITTCYTHGLGARYFSEALLAHHASRVPPIPPPLPPPESPPAQMAPVTPATILSQHQQQQQFPVQTVQNARQEMPSNYYHPPHTTASRPITPETTPSMMHQRVPPPYSHQPQPQPQQPPPPPPPQSHPILPRSPESLPERTHHSNLGGETRDARALHPPPINSGYTHSAHHPSNAQMRRRSPSPPPPPQQAMMTPQRSMMPMPLPLVETNGIQSVMTNHQYDMPSTSQHPAQTTLNYTNGERLDPAHIPQTQVQPGQRPSNRKPRTCRKCGRVGISVAGPETRGCAGASDVKNCKNPCRDCGRQDCMGRDPKKWKGKTPCENARQAIEGASAGGQMPNNPASAGPVPNVVGGPPNGPGPGISILDDRHPPHGHNHGGHSHGHVAGPNHAHGGHGHSAHGPPGPSSGVHHHTYQSM